MKRIISGAIFLVMIGLSLFQVGCTLPIGGHPSPVYAPLPLESGPPPWAPAHGHRAKHHYYYYPESHVYFDVGRSLYFYYYGGGWQASVSLPSGIRISAGEYVSLDMDNDRPYIYHADVEKRYPPGQLKKKKKERTRNGIDLNYGKRGNPKQNSLFNYPFGNQNLFSSPSPFSEAI